MTSESKAIKFDMTYVHLCMIRRTHQLDCEKRIHSGIDKGLDAEKITWKEIMKRDLYEIHVGKSTSNLANRQLQDSRLAKINFM